MEQPSDYTATFADPPALSEVVEPESTSTEQNEFNERVSTQRSAYWLDDTGIQILRATRSWIQYGTVGFAVMCILIGALEGLFGR